MTGLSLALGCLRSGDVNIEHRTPNIEHRSEKNLEMKWYQAFPVPIQSPVQRRFVVSGGGGSADDGLVLISRRQSGFRIPRIDEDAGIKDGLMNDE
jgi:hypothetical protein